MTAESGLCVVDKPAGWTSHDVVARVRRLARTRRVGHAGTLDPMATGVLVLGIERATRLLGHLAITDKSYDATIRLGQQTVSDDADGAVLAEADATPLPDAAIRAALGEFVGEFDQVPAAVSAVKVDGRRSYHRVRAGEAVALAPRRVRVSRLEVRHIRREQPMVVDVEVSLDCSTGTYVRAIARDVGAALRVGGHLTALRRTRVGAFSIADARSLEQLAARPSPVTVPLPDAVAASFPRRDLDSAQTERLGHGAPIEPAGIAAAYGAFGPDGSVVALVEERDHRARPIVVFC